MSAKKKRKKKDTLDWDANRLRIKELEAGASKRRPFSERMGLTPPGKPRKRAGKEGGG